MEKSSVKISEIRGLKKLGERAAEEAGTNGQEWKKLEPRIARIYTEQDDDHEKRK